MANIFSGLFAGGQNSSAAKLAQYRQQLEDYKTAKDAYEQQEALSNIDPYIKQVLENMTPERQSQVMLQRAMMRQEPMFDKGIEGFNNSIKQRGGTIADQLKQRLATEEANKKHQYKVDNPIVEDPAIVLATKFYMGDDWEDASLEERQQALRDVKRQRQYLDLEDRLMDPMNKDVVVKNLIKAGVDKASAPFIEERLRTFQSNITKTESFLEKTADQRERIQWLYKNAEGNTGWYGLASAIPDIKSEGGSRQWQEIKKTVIANVALDKILDLKASSAQGATGLGALNEKELETLEKHLGSLEQANTPEALKKVLLDMDKDLDRLQKQKLSALGKERSWYNRNKRYIGLKPTDPDFVPETQEYLFSGEPYKPVKGESPLDPNNEQGEIIQKYNLQELD